MSLPPLAQSVKQILGVPPLADPTADSEEDGGPTAAQVDAMLKLHLQVLTLMTKAGGTSPRERLESACSLLQHKTFLSYLMYYVCQGHMLLCIPLRLLCACIAACFEQSYQEFSDASSCDMPEDVEEAVYSALQSFLNYEEGELFFGLLSLLKTRDKLLLNSVAAMMTLLCMGNGSKGKNSKTVTRMSLMLSQEPSVATICIKLHSAGFQSCVMSMLKCLMGTREGVGALRKAEAAVHHLVAAAPHLKQEWNLVRRL